MRRPTNPLALAVLELLWEGPMHPYEMSATLRGRKKEDSIRLNYGSLYSVVESLAKQQLIEVLETSQEGRRPARTTYALTAAGAETLTDWLSELLSVPTPQFTDFEAALSLMPALPVPEVCRLLSRRLQALRDRQAAVRAQRDQLSGFPEIFLIETEYQAALRDAEIAFVQQLLDDMDSGTLTGLRGWQRVHELRAEGHSTAEIQTILATEMPEEFRWMT